MAGAFAAGYLTAKPLALARPNAETIRQAEAYSNKAWPPYWLDRLQNDPRLKAMRARGYQYCQKNGSIDKDCAYLQDQAIIKSEFAIMISIGQQKMTEAQKNGLSDRERWVSFNPHIRNEVIDYCTRLYEDHGGRDARIFSVCLGNLTDFSPLVALPVVD